MIATAPITAQDAQDHGTLCDECSHSLGPGSLEVHIASARLRLCAPCAMVVVSVVTDALTRQGAPRR